MTDLELSRQILSVWAELVEAEHGINRYGGDTAELYVYRLAPNTTAAGTLDHRAAAVANAVLLDILEQFASQREVTVRVDGQAPGAWMVTCDNRHRWHVRVRRVADKSVRVAVVD